MLDDDILNNVKDEEENNKAENEIVEIDENEEITNTQYDLNEVTEDLKKDKKKKKEKGPSKWSKLTKKQKIIIIVCGILLLLIILILILYFLVFKNAESNDSNEDDEPIVIVEKDNYRYEDGKLIFIDEGKNELGSYECSNKDEDLCYVAYYSNEDEFDIEKQVYENGVPIDFRSDILLNNYVFIYDNSESENGQIQLYNIKNEEVIENYLLVKKVSDDQVIVKNEEEEYGILKFSVDEVKNIVDFDYDYLGYILETDYVVGANNNNYVLLDLEGEEASKNIPGEIKNFDSNNISVKIDNSYYVYNYQGNRVIDEEYDYIRFIDSYIIAASNRRLYVYDSEGSRMTMEGYRISSSDYNTKLIFNEELRQTGKEEAFNAYLSGDTMRIEYDDEIIDINLNEGKFNKTQEYYSYYQGKLYFYSDAEKTELLGSYNCEYANTINADTTELTNCNVAKESKVLNTSDDINVGYLPIYNERYIFISDTKSPNANDNIKLVDLKATGNQELATYKEVDAGYYNAENVINFVETAGTPVLVKNTSDSYGLINIGSSNINRLIDFRYDDDKVTNVNVKNLDGNILMQRSDGSYHLYDIKGNEITENITTTNEIIDYKSDYILVKSNDNYMIYNLDGSIVSDEYKYIILENTYYITVDSNNTIGVFTFSKGNVNLAESQSIKIDGKDYANEIKYGLNGNVLVITYTINNQKEVVEINIS